MRELIHAVRCDFLFLQEIHRASGPGRGQQGHTFGTRIIYACAQLIGAVGHATRSATVPVSRSRMQSLQQRCYFIFSGSRSSAAVGIADRPPRSL